MWLQSLLADGQWAFLFDEFFLALTLMQQAKVVQIL